MSWNFCPDYKPGKMFTNPCKVNIWYNRKFFIIPRDWIDLFRHLKVICFHRFYSISSSSRVHNESVHVTAVVVEYETPTGRKNKVHIFYYIIIKWLFAVRLSKPVKFDLDPNYRGTILNFWPWGVMLSAFQVDRPTNFCLRIVWKPASPWVSMHTF